MTVSSKVSFVRLQRNSLLLELAVAVARNLEMKFPVLGPDRTVIGSGLRELPVLKPNTSPYFRNSEESRELRFEKAY